MGNRNHFPFTSMRTSAALGQRPYSSFPILQGASFSSLSLAGSSLERFFFFPINSHIEKIGGVVLFIDIEFPVALAGKLSNTCRARRMFRAAGCCRPGGGSMRFTPSRFCQMAGTMRSVAVMVLNISSDEGLWYVVPPFSRRGILHKERNRNASSKWCILPHAAVRCRLPGYSWRRHCR